MAEKKQTHFGYQDVDWQEKTGKVREVFDSVAERYDLMNDLMSTGLHRIWKDIFVNKLQPRKGMRIVDVAGGTGDIAFRMARQAECEITVCDINHEMLEVGRNRAIDKNIAQPLKWVCGNAESMPLPSGSVDAYTIAFGIRNVTDIPAALSEAFRVLRPGGHFMCLEFSKVDNHLLDKIYDFYSFKVIPEVGRRVTGDRDAYQYLVESIRQFPSQENFVSMLREAGFSRVNYTNLSGGVVAIHSGWRI